ncbi:MAG: ABC transporter ATP-binding protein [Promethearchaeota archaeon]|nr:MAG: ABC transporter ATP-binding protein [Candidatus Lokiarchaeota archaeon]
MAPKTPIISISEVSFHYLDGTQALKDINLNIPKGSILSIMGKNGAGKTTLIRTLNGLIRPQRGSIYIKGENISSKSIATLSQKVGIIFQTPSHQLFSTSVEEELKFSLKNLKWKDSQIEEKVNEILEEFNLQKYRERSPLNLSGGEMKKLAIASIICRDPDILIFDEPTLGQDGKEIKFFIDLITREKQKGKTIIIITHNVEFTLEYIPRTILMADGEILADGPTKDLLTNDLLVKEASLIYPQMFLFKAQLLQEGISCPEDIITQEQMIRHLKNICSQKNHVKEGI